MAQSSVTSDTLIDTVTPNTKQRRFMIVGFISTLVDFTVLLLLHSVGFVSIGANFISTFCGFLISFFSNRHYTFEATSGNVHKQIIGYFIVTFIGIWLFQPGIIYLVQRWLEPSGLKNWIILVCAKLIATGVTLIWNYITYNKVVFRHHKGPR